MDSLGVIRTGVIAASVLGGALLGEYGMPGKKPFSKYEKAQYRLLEKYDTKYPLDSIDLDEARELMSTEFGGNEKEGLFTREQEDKAIDFIANLYVPSHRFPVTPLNLVHSRYKLLHALYERSSNTSNTQRKLVERIEQLKQKQKIVII